MNDDERLLEMLGDPWASLMRVELAALVCLIAAAVLTILAGRSETQFYSLMIPAGLLIVVSANSERLWSWCFYRRFFARAHAAGFTRDQIDQFLKSLEVVLNDETD